MTDNSTANLYRDFGSDPDGRGYDRMVHVRETPHGIFRAVVEHDDYPDAPHFDYGCPIIEIERGGYGGARFSMVNGQGGESAWADGLSDDLAAILQRVYDGGPDGYGSDNAGCCNVGETLEIVNRWLRAFHGGSLTIFSSSIDRSGSTYVAYDTRAMRAEWGQTGDMLETSDPDGGEWQAYLDGDVYIVSVERADDFDDDGEPCGWDVVEGPVHGHYGDDWAAQAALDMLDAEIDYTAANMLPIGERWDGEGEGYGSCGVKGCTDCT